MERPRSSPEQVNILSDDSSSDDGAGPESKRLRTAAEIPQRALQIIPEDVMLGKAQTYQEYMRQIPIPLLRGSVVPFTSWTGLGTSLKQLYGQPLHYLTNVHLRQLDILRIGAEDEDRPLDTIIPPPKAEASIWLIEEVHRLSSSHHHLAKLWHNDPLHHIFIDPIFIELQKPSR
ncbi:unnamed protein product [Coffea canephora]|uniref:Protein RDM1 n=3 Tax=Coffea TaxID=13442 RepID=A0A068TX91_COFCA|nr:protein RDM1-like [Coffea arabica]XP_027094537.1 protein RDM1-like [Coffea arabica]CDP00920.1 unnamed protein product [Coffea canephora]